MSLTQELAAALGDLLETPLGGNPRVHAAHARQRARALLERLEPQPSTEREQSYRVPCDRHPPYALPEVAR